MGTFNFAQRAFVVSGDKLLLVKKSADDPIHPNKWEVPGGRMEFGESVEENIKREVKEETGIEIKVGEPFDIWTWFMNKADSNGSVRQIQVVAVARLCEAKMNEVSVSGQVREDFLAEAKWVPVNDVLSYDLIPEIIPVMKKFLSRFANI